VGDKVWSPPEWFQHALLGGATFKRLENYDKFKLAGLPRYQLGYITSPKKYKEFFLQHNQKSPKRLQELDKTLLVDTLGSSSNEEWEPAELKKIPEDVLRNLTENLAILDIYAQNKTMDNINLERSKTLQHDSKPIYPPVSGPQEQYFSDIVYHKAFAGFRSANNDKWLLEAWHLKGDKLRNLIFHNERFDLVRRLEWTINEENIECKIDFTEWEKRSFLKTHNDRLGEAGYYNLQDFVSEDSFYAKELLDVFNRCGIIDVTLENGVIKIPKNIMKKYAKDLNVKVSEDGLPLKRESNNEISAYLKPKLEKTEAEVKESPMTKSNILMQKIGFYIISEKNDICSLVKDFDELKISTEDLYQAKAKLQAKIPEGSLQTSLFSKNIKKRIMLIDEVIEKFDNRKSNDASPEFDGPF